MTDNPETPRKPRKPKVEKTAEQLKAEGMRRVLENEKQAIRDAYTNAFGKLPCGWVGTSEDFKFEWWSMTQVRPHHHNFYGAMWNSFARHGYIEFTGDREHASSPSRHSNPNDIWRKIV